MIKRMKKGFTLVELVVVIAVVAILAAVSVVTYMSITKKAKESHDQQIIDQINLSLSAEETAGRKPETMHKALEVLEKDGFAPERFNSLYGPTIGYDLAYLLKENKFVLLNQNSEDVDIVYPSGDLTAAKHELWKFAKAADSLADGFSHYLSGDDQTGDRAVSTGLDVGKNTGISAVTYTGAEPAKDVIIRTNNISTELTIDAVADTIRHYNIVGEVNVIKTADGSYHEYGTAGYVQVASGRVVAESGGTINAVVLTEKGAGATLPAVLEVKTGGVVTNKYATSTDVAHANNAEARSYQLSLLPTTSVGGNIIALEEGESLNKVLSEVKAESMSSMSSGEAIRVVDMTTFVDLAIPESFVREEISVVSLKYGFYKDAEYIFDADVDCNYSIVIKANTRVTLDLNGHILRMGDYTINDVHTPGDEAAGIYVEEGATLIVKDTSAAGNGKIDNLTNLYAMVWNEGTVFAKSGNIRNASYFAEVGITFEENSVVGGSITVSEGYKGNINKISGTSYQNKKGVVTIGKGSYIYDPQKYIPAFKEIQEYTAGNNYTIKQSIFKNGSLTIYTIVKDGENYNVTNARYSSGGLFYSDHQSEYPGYVEHQDYTEENEYRIQLSPFTIDGTTYQFTIHKWLERPGYDVPVFELIVNKVVTE